jgi:hypothetical protein
VKVVQADVVGLNKKSKEMVDKLKKDKDYNDKVIEAFKRYQPADSEILKLNIGGSLFSTLKSTLTKKIKKNENEFYKASIFESLLSDATLDIKYDENKAIFIDRNPNYFSLILDYLRMANTDNEFELPNNVNKNEILKEAKFYSLEGLIQQIK